MKTANNINLSTYSYIFAVIIYSIVKLFSTTYIDEAFKVFVFISKYINIFVFCLLVFSFICNFSLKRKKLLYFFSLVLISFLVLLFNFDQSLLLIIMFIISYPKDYDISKLAKYLIISNSFVIISSIILCKCGIIRNYTFMQRGFLRNSFGFVSANALANSICTTVLLYILSRKKEWKLVNTITSLIIILITYYFTYSRLPLIILFLVTLYKVFEKRIKKSTMMLNSILSVSKYIYIVLLIFSLVIMLNIKSIVAGSSFININQFFSGRLSQIFKFCTEYSIGIFGQNIETVGIRTAILNGVAWDGIDVSYINYSLRYGLLFMFSFAILFYKLGTYFKSTKYVEGAVYIVLICVMGLTENILFIPYYNFSIFMIACMLKNFLCETEQELLI